MNCELFDVSIDLIRRSVLPCFHLPVVHYTVLVQFQRSCNVYTIYSKSLAASAHHAFTKPITTSLIKEKQYLGYNYYSVSVVLSCSIHRGAISRSTCAGTTIILLEDLVLHNHLINPETYSGVHAWPEWFSFLTLPLPYPCLPPQWIPSSCCHLQH